jgi:hypothetical protein
LTDGARALIALTKELPREGVRSHADSQVSRQVTHSLWTPTRKRGRVPALPTGYPQRDPALPGRVPRCLAPQGAADQQLVLVESFV